MINIKYKNMYDKFINHYKGKHINPWHEISEEELNNLFDELTDKIDIIDDYTFNYFMNFIIKKLSGSSDAHTSYNDVERLPMNFRMFDDEIIVNYPNSLKGFKLISINGIAIDKICMELENVITYGTKEKRQYELEKSLFNKKKLFGLPSLRGSSLVFQFLSLENEKVEKEFKKEEQYLNQEMFDYDEYCFGKPGTYEFKDNCLVIHHSSVQPKFEEAIKNSVEKLKQTDLSDIDTIIVDIRGNTGGNSILNRPLMEFLEESNKKLYCLTDYRVFSGGRYALLNLQSLGAITVGTPISTPLNCYGNSNWINCDGHYFSASSSFLAPNFGISVSSREEFKSIPDKLLEPCLFTPDIFIKQAKEDYLNNVDPVLEYVINDSKLIKERK